VSQKDVLQPSGIKAISADVGYDPIYLQANAGVNQGHLRAAVDQIDVAIQIVTQTESQPPAAHDMDVLG
jgi:hypothetical protein